MGSTYSSSSWASNRLLPVGAFGQVYLITFDPNNGDPTVTVRVVAGETPTYPNGTPTKSGYTFDGWSPAITPASADTTYTATYVADAPVYHTITFLDSDGTTVIRTDQVEHGHTITPPTVTPPAGYVFDGWNPAVPATATADGTYTATYIQDQHGVAAGPFYIGAISSSDANSQFHCVGDEAVSGNAYPNLNTNAVYTITGKYYVNNAVVEEFSGTATTTPAGGFAPDVTLSSELAKYGWEDAATTGNGWKLLKSGMEAFQPTGEYWEFYISCPTYIIRKYDDHHAYCRL